MMCLNKIQNWMGPLLLGLVLSLSFSAEAASLGLQQANPDIQASGLDIQYQASSGEFAASSALFSWLTYDFGSLADVDNADYQLSVILDSSGNLQSGSFSISGGISELGIASGSNLIAGSVSAFGFTDKTVDLFEFVVTGLSGALSAEYGAELGIIMSTNADSNFAGIFTTDFTGSAMAYNFSLVAAPHDDLTTVPLPPAVWLFASGLAAMLGGAGLKKRA